MKPKTSSLANKFSRIIAGTMSWGSWGIGFSRDEMISLMHCCLDSGISTFDSADIYGGYTNEADYGNAFAESGKIRHFELSNFTPSQLALIVSEIAVKGNQVEFSLTADKVMYDGTLDDCLLLSGLALAWSPLGGYFGLQHNKQGRIRQVLEIFSHKFQVSEMELLLAWLLKYPANVFPAVGTTRETRLKQSATAINIQLESDDWFELPAPTQDHKVPQIEHV
jgi:predicted oxidoreductase